VNDGKQSRESLDSIPSVCGWSEGGRRKVDDGWTTGRQLTLDTRKRGHTEGIDLDSVN
jgi:hypothetical protein